MRFQQLLNQPNKLFTKIEIKFKFLFILSLNLRTFTTIFLLQSIE